MKNAVNITVRDHYVTFTPMSSHVIPNGVSGDFEPRRASPRTPVGMQAGWPGKGDFEPRGGEGGVARLPVSD